MNNISLCIYFLNKQIKNKFGYYLKQVLIMSLIFSIVAILNIIPESYKYLREVPVEKAQYDYLINGMLYDDQYEALKSNPDIETVVATSEWDGMRITNNHNGKQVINNIFFINNINNAGQLLPSSNYFIKEGKYSENTAVITARLADDLNLKIGDAITIDWSTFHLPGYATQYLISGILYETSSGECIEADINPAKESIQSVVKILYPYSHTADYSQFYVKMNAPNSDKRIISNFLNDKQTLFSRSDILAIERAQVDGLSTVQLGYEQKGILILYLLVFIGYSLMKMRNQKLFYKILSMIGAPNILSYYHIILENALIITMVACVSVFLAYKYFQLFLSIYFPMAVFSSLIKFTLLANLYVLIVTSIVGIIALNRLFLNRSLVKE